MPIRRARVRTGAFATLAGTAIIAGVVTTAPFAKASESPLSLSSVLGSVSGAPSLECQFSIPATPFSTQNSHSSFGMSVLTESGPLVVFAGQSDQPKGSGSGVKAGDAGSWGDELPGGLPTNG